MGVICKFVCRSRPDRNERSLVKVINETQTLPDPTNLRVLEEPKPDIGAIEFQKVP